MATKLNFINQSTAAESLTVVFTQRNVAPPQDGLLVAWQVIARPANGHSQVINVPMSMEISANDSYGNYMPRKAAQYGQMFEVALDRSGDVLSYVGQAPSSAEVAARNSLNRGAVGFNIYKGGALLATRQNVAPGQRAFFQFKPSIWIGLLPSAAQGEVLSEEASAVPSAELSLQGILSADIVLTGGGSTPFQFQMANIEQA
nr:hypothetical protein [uncultured Duganella sp.]